MHKDDDYNQWYSQSHNDRSKRSKDDDDDDSGIGSNSIELGQQIVSESTLQIMQDICGDLSAEDIRMLLKEGHSVTNIMEAAASRKKVIDLEQKRRELRQSYSGPDQPDNSPDHDPYKSSTDDLDDNLDPNPGGPWRPPTPG